MATNTDKNSSMGIAIHPSLVGGGVDPDGLKGFLDDRAARGHRLYVMASMTLGDSESAMTHLEEAGAFRSKDDGGLGFTKREVFFPRSPAVLAHQLRSANITCYVGRDDSFASYRGFPKGTLGLSVGTASGAAPAFSSWQALNAFLDADVIANLDVEELVTLRQRTASIYRITGAQGGLLLNAHWNETDLGAEKSRLEAASGAGIPSLEQVWASGNVSVYKDPGGVKLSKVTHKDLDRLGAFMVALDKKSDQLKDQPNAPDARFHLDSYLKAVNTLWNQVSAAATKHHKDTMFFMMTDLEQLRQDNINHFFLWTKREKWDKEQELPQKERIYKPGQLGFHNTLIVGDDMIVLDSSGAGWDDPARIIADFFLNNEQTLDTREKLRVLDAFTSHRSWDETFIKRFWAVADLLAVEWILKLFDVLLPERRERLLATLTDKEYNDLVASRLERAKYLRENFETMEHQCKHDQLLDKGTKIS